MNNFLLNKTKNKSLINRIKAINFTAKEFYYRLKIKLNPRDADAYSNLGKIVANHDLLESAKYYTLAIDCDRPNAAHIHCLLAETLLKLNKIAETVSACQQSIALNPHNFKSYFFLGQAYFKLNKDDQAIANLKQAIELNPQFSWSYYHLGQAYFKLNKDDQAIANFRYCDRAKPPILLVLLLSGLCFKKTRTIASSSSSFLSSY